MPDYVASFAVTTMKTTTCMSIEPGMTYKSGHFEVKSLLPSRNLKKRLDELLFRAAEAQVSYLRIKVCNQMTHAVYGTHLFMQFYRMFKIQEHDRKRVCVVQVDVVDNGDLNI